MTTPHRLRRRIGSKAKVLFITSLLLAVGTAGTAQASTNAPQQTGSAAAASTSTPSMGASSDQAAYAAALKSPDWVTTPEGLVNKSCEHTVPPGATFDQNENRVVLASGVKEPAFQRCAYSPLLAPGQGETAKAPSAASFTPGWQAYSWWNSPQWLTGIVSTFEVPKAPSVGGTEDFFFSSLQSSGNFAIVQAVLRWERNQWYIQSEYYWGGKDVRGNMVAVAPGDTISTVVGAGGCSSGGDCSWYIDGTDLVTNQVSSLNINAAQPFISAQGGVMELPDNPTACNQLPASGNIDFDGIYVYGSSHQTMSPSWGVSNNGNNKGYCGVYVDTSATETYMPW